MWWRDVGDGASRHRNACGAGPFSGSVQSRRTRAQTTFEPFAVGYVDLGPVRVESRLEGKPADNWRIGDAVRLVAGAPDANGDVWSYRFVAADAVTPGDAA